MKTKALLLSVVLLTVVTISSYAQGFHLGIKAGTNIFKIDGRSFNDEFKFAYSVGAFAEINFTSKFGIQPELLWNQTNFRTAQNFSSVVPPSQGGYDYVNGSLNYLSIPLLLTYRPVKVLSLQAGPQFGILINQSTIAQASQDAFKKGDFSILAGAQLNIGGVKIGARYFIGLNNINNLSNTDTWKNQGFQAYVGLRII